MYDRARTCSWYCMLCFQPLDDSNSRLQPFALRRTIRAMKSIWEGEVRGEETLPKHQLSCRNDSKRVCIAYLCVWPHCDQNVTVCEDRQEGDVRCWLQNLSTQCPAIKGAIFKKQFMVFSKQLDPNFPLIRCDS